MGRELLGEEDDDDDVMDSFDLGGEDEDLVQLYPTGAPSVSAPKRTPMRRKGLGSVFNISLDKKAMRKAGLRGREDELGMDEREKKKKKKKTGLGWGNPLTPGVSPPGMVASPGESVENVGNVLDEVLRLVVRRLLG